MTLVLLEGRVPITVVVDSVTGEVRRSWVDRDAVEWLAPSWVLPAYRRALIGTHNAAMQAANEAPTWVPVLERPPDVDGRP